MMLHGFYRTSLPSLCLLDMFVLPNQNRIHLSTKVLCFRSPWLCYEREFMNTREDARVSAVGCHGQYSRTDPRAEWLCISYVYAPGGE